MAKATALTMAAVDYLLGLPGPFSSPEDLDSAVAQVNGACRAASRHSPGQPELTDDDEYLYRREQED